MLGRRVAVDLPWSYFELPCSNSLNAARFRHCPGDCISMAISNPLATGSKACSAMGLRMASDAVDFEFEPLSSTIYPTSNTVARKWKEAKMALDVFFCVFNTGHNTDISRNLARTVRSRPHLSTHPEKEHGARHPLLRRLGLAHPGGRGHSALQYWGPGARAALLLQIRLSLTAPTWEGPNRSPGSHYPPFSVG